MNVDTIAGLQRYPGPFVSAYFDVTRDTADAPHRIDLAWRPERERLLAAGAPSSLVEQVQERVLRPTSAPGPVSRMVIAAGEDVLVDDEIRRPNGATVVSWGPLPDVSGWVVDRDTMVSVLLVLADREGADLELYDPWPGFEVDEESVDGERLHINKVPSGGWSHKQYQRHTEEVWRRNAEEVAAEVDELARKGVRLVVLAGDVHAVGNIRGELAEPTASKTVTLEVGSRAEDGSRESLDDAVGQAVRDVVVREHLAMVRELEEGSGQRATSAYGIPDVIEGLIQGKVRTLLLAPGTAAGYGVPPAEYPGLPLSSGALEHQRLRADLVTICAAAATDAEVVVLGPKSLPDDGVAAIMRWQAEPAAAE
ncbi:hypothetical protein CLV30_101183 [Haloactinopolyspora alba]|uniref:Peptide subunit release factor 1 (ERF1) n=1 Tax=Haloactinopolyspora alba TaxID=648780 RepID=A0A2P8EFI0_9ACTN|nr:Vms1/Ankzf1 family peptidyl-tRNA hydrolase [Haloactinopolyspora alba]PSL08213.1 hypothetical protein CLV30_101183 [Haloactinopolyspora alba]